MQGDGSEWKLMLLVVHVGVFVVVLMRNARMTSIVVGNVDDACCYGCTVAGDDCYGDYCGPSPSLLSSLYYLIQWLHIPLS